ncbi:MAG: adenylate/guanylate cyclase domain-containing protein [Chloroflexota bacterium]
MSEHGHILVVDDLRTNRLKLSIGLKQQGHTVAEVGNGREALDLLHAVPFDLVLLDIFMPEMDGYEVLERMKNDSALRDIPVIVISAHDELESVVRCIELGAEDYLPKSFDPVLLRARIEACLEKKRLRDKEQAYMREIQLEREKSEQLLLNILPAPVAARLKQTHDIIADSFGDASVMFIDIVDFTPLATHMSPVEMVNLLNEVFSAIDALAERHNLEKVKTSGDSYLVVGGLPIPRAGHLEAMADMALDVQAMAAQFSRMDSAPFQLRVGIHAGPVVAGVIGIRRFIYDLWGDTVNIASRMESHGIPGAIQVTQAVRDRLHERYHFQARGAIAVKGKGTMMTYLLTGKMSH